MLVLRSRRVRRSPNQPSNHPESDTGSGSGDSNTLARVQLGSLWRGTRRPNRILVLFEDAEVIVGDDASGYCRLGKNSSSLIVPFVDTLAQPSDTGTGEAITDIVQFPVELGFRPSKTVTCLLVGR